MRGKKTDPEFIGRFIQESVQSGAETPLAILRRAKEQIDQIDNEIIALEFKKVIRSKLLDVVSSFEYPSKDKTEEAKLLEFYKLKYPVVCKDICDSLKDHQSLPVLSWASFGDKGAERNFCIKQLIEADIIMKVSDQLVRGKKFDEYMKFVLQEDK